MMKGRLYQLSCAEPREQHRDPLHLIEPAHIFRYSAPLTNLPK